MTTLTLIDFVALIWSIFPSIVILRIFVVQKGGRWRSPYSGQYVSDKMVQFWGLVATIVSYVFLNPPITEWVTNFCSNNSSNLFAMLGIGLLLYFFVLKP